MEPDQGRARVPRHHRRALGVSRGQTWIHPVEDFDALSRARTPCSKRDSEIETQDLVLDCLKLSESLCQLRNVDPFGDTSLSVLPDGVPIDSSVAERAQVHG